jgi:hypothetical protein
MAPRFLETLSAVMTPSLVICVPAPRAIAVSVVVGVRLPVLLTVTPVVLLEKTAGGRVETRIETYTALVPLQVTVSPLAGVRIPVAGSGVLPDGAAVQSAQAGPPPNRAQTASASVERWGKGRTDRRAPAARSAAGAMIGAWTRWVMVGGSG